MLNADLIAILCCPETHQPVSLASADLVQAFNDKIKSGSLQNKAGEKISEPIEGALIREDNRFAYLIRNGIPNLLIDQAVPVI
jgi:uncharacterized protein YbaR (Trm112 family)